MYELLRTNMKSMSGAELSVKCVVFLCHGLCILVHCVVLYYNALFVCVEVLRPSQPNGVMSSAVSLSNHTFTGQA